MFNNSSRRSARTNNSSKKTRFSLNSPRSNFGRNPRHSSSVPYKRSAQEGSPNKRPRHSYTPSPPPVAADDDYGDKTLNNDSRDALDSDDCDFPWDEEKTLLSELMEDFPDSQSEIDTLADSLQASFTSEGKRVKVNIATTFVPTVNRVKNAYHTLDKINNSLGQGVLAFNKACKHTERATVEEQDKLSAAFARSQKNIEYLFSQLEQSYCEREQLWVDFNKTVNERLTAFTETLKETPATVERTISSFEKQCRTLEKEVEDSLRKEFQAMVANMM